MSNKVTKPKFELGILLKTSGIDSRYTFHQIMELVNRHHSGDWGDLSPHDKKENDLALKEGFRIFSSYKMSDNSKVWVITEADRSCTTVLLPEEY